MTEKAHGLFNVHALGVRGLVTGIHDAISYDWPYDELCKLGIFLDDEDFDDGIIMPAPPPRKQ